MASVVQLCFEQYFQSPVNLAHLKERRAEEFLASNNFDEAIAHLSEAAGILQKFLDCEWNSSVSKSASVRISLQLQVRQHLSKVKLITLKKHEHSIKEQKSCPLVKSCDSSGYVREQYDDDFNQISVTSLGSIESVDSIDCVTPESNSGTGMNHGISNVEIEQACHKEVIQRLAFYVREQQNEILRLSQLLQGKDREIQLLKSRLEDLEKCSR